MRLQKILNEYKQKKVSIEDINNLIHKNCKQYLKLIKGVSPMFRGMDIHYDIGISGVRKDRRPFGMKREEADMLNKYLGDNNHMRRDESVLCTTNSNIIEMFGESAMIFPLDNIIGYTWIDTEDINLYGSNGWEPYSAMSGLNQVNGVTITKNQQKTLDKLNKPWSDYFHTNHLFHKAHVKGYEMWINCKQYYYVDSDMYTWSIKNEIIK